MQHGNDRQIAASWKKNAQAWIEAIRRGEIESRVLATDQAILDSVLSRAPKTVLDAGCGEGWLVRELCRSGIDALGIDAEPALIDYARQANVGRFKLLSYEDLTPQTLNQRFDAVVCNFSLLGDAAVQRLVRQIPSLLNEAGAFIVQTPHPVAVCGELPYEDGWRQGSWQGFSHRFTDPAPWFFRTLESWQRLIAESGLKLLETREPLNPKTGLPASVIFIAERMA